jgi:hypothetical protein
MKKILIVLNSKMHIRNYLSTNVLTHFDGYDLNFLVEEEIKKSLPPSLKVVGTFKANPDIEKKHIKFFDYLTWRFRSRSKSFMYRFKRMYIFEDVQGGFLKPLRLIKKYLKAFKVMLMATNPFFYFVKKHYEKALVINEGLKSQIEAFKPDLIIFPSSAYDPIGNDVLRISKNKFKTLFLIDNWDNLSSKSIMWEKPNFLTVWSEQAVEHALNVQDFKLEQVHIVGTSRFDVYLQKEAAPIYSYPYVVFAGCTLGFDEITALTILENEIENNPDLYQRLKVIYRPHPWRQKRNCYDIFEQSKFKHVIMDEQIAEAYYSKISSSNFQPDLNYYPRLLKNGLFMVCPLSTMMLESLICKRDVLTIAYYDGIHKTSPNFVYSSYKHFEKIENLKGVSFCHEQESFAKKFRETFEKQINYSPENYEDVKYFVYSDNRNYNDRLLNVINKVTK